MQWPVHVINPFFTQKIFDILWSATESVILHEDRKLNWWELDMWKGMLFKNLPVDFSLNSPL